MFTVSRMIDCARPSNNGGTCPYKILPCEDLRWRMVWQRLNCCTIKKAVDRLFVAEATVWRVVDRFQRTGDVSANKASSREHCLDDLTMS